MTAGFKKNNKFIPISGSSSSDISSDQVENKEPEPPQMDSTKIEELKKKNQS